MASYQIINGIPTHIQPVLGKVDFEKIGRERELDPHHKLVSLGFSDKEAYIIELSNRWERVKIALTNGATKEQIINLK